MSTGIGLIGTDVADSYSSANPYMGSSFSGDPKRMSPLMRLGQGSWARGLAFSPKTGSELKGEWQL